VGRCKLSRRGSGLKADLKRILGTVEKYVTQEGGSEWGVTKCDRGGERVLQHVMSRL